MKIKNLFNQNKKEFIFNFFGFGSVEILSLLLPILTMPVLTRALGPDVYGNFLLMMTIVYLGPTFIDYSTQFNAVKDISECRDDLVKRKKIYSGVQGLRLLLFFGFALVSLIYIYIFKFDELFVVYCLAGLPYLLGYSLLPMWYFQGVGEAYVPLRWLLAMKVLTMLLIVLLIRDESDFIVTSIIFCWPMLLLGIYYTVCVCRKYRCGFDYSDFFSLLSRGRHIFLGNLAPNFYNTFPIVFLGSVVPSTDFVQFAIATRIATVVTTFQNVLVKAAYPLLAKRGKDGVYGLFFANFIMVIPVIFFIFFWGNDFLLIFLGSGYEYVHSYLKILIIGVLFVGLSGALSKGYFLVYGYDVLYRSISVTISFVSCVLVGLSIYLFGLIGCVVSLTISRLLMFLGFFYYYTLTRKARGLSE